ncbi:MAG TPA: hypothetical protein VFY08_01910 [Actinomycetota bacterium]|nr:hypothetical protein [Actinomycetota bacterium]
MTLESWVLVGSIAALAIGWLLYLRSIRRWKDTEPTSAETKQAQARLWSTRSMDQR